MWILPTTFVSENELRTTWKTRIHSSLSFFLNKDTHAIASSYLKKKNSNNVSPSFIFPCSLDGWLFKKFNMTSHVSALPEFYFIYSSGYPCLFVYSVTIRLPCLNILTYIYFFRFWCGYYCGWIQIHLCLSFQSYSLRACPFLLLWVFCFMEGGKIKKNNRCLLRKFKLSCIWIMFSVKLIRQFSLFSTLDYLH
jgi:hypothetical protein